MTDALRTRITVEQIIDAGEFIRTVSQRGRHAFMTDRLVRDAVIRNFEVIGEAAKRLPDEVRALSPGVPWKQVAGLRDWLIHGYDAVDYGRLWNVIEHDLDPLIEEARRLRALPGMEGS